jgi:hypothetical protein
MQERKVIKETRDFVRWLCVFGSFFGIIGLGYISMFFFTQERDRGIYLLIGAMATIFGIIALAVAWHNHRKMKRILSQAE